MVERPLCMREVLGSTPGFSIQSQRPTLRLTFLTGACSDALKLQQQSLIERHSQREMTILHSCLVSFSSKYIFRLLPRSFPSHFIITGATIKSLIINELLLWETSLLFTIGPMHAYIRVQPLTTKPRSSKIISKPLRSFTYVTWEFFPFTLLWEFTGVNVHAIRR